MKGLAVARKEGSGFADEMKKAMKNLGGGDIQASFDNLGKAAQSAFENLKTKAISALKDLPGKIKDILGKIVGFFGDMGKAAADAFLSAVGNLVKGVSAVVTAASAAFAGFAASAVMTAARVGEMDAVLEQLAKTSGISKAAMDAEIKTIRERGITMGTAQNLVAQFTRNNLDLAKATGLARTAQDLAIFTQKDSSETLEELLHYIQTGNSQLEVARQLNINTAAAQEKYAASVGKSVNDLTEAEKAQARLNAIQEAGVNIQGAYEAAMKEPGKVLRSFPRLIDDIQVALGGALLPAFGDIIFKAYEFVKAFTASIEKGGALRPIIEALGEAASNFLKPLGDLIAKLTEWLKGLNTEQVGGFLDTLKEFAPILATVGGALLATGSDTIKGFLGPLGNIIPTINPVLGALIGLVAGSEDVRGALGGIIEELKPIGEILMNSLAPVLKEIGPLFADLIKAIAPLAGEVIVALVEILRQVAPLFLDLLKVVVPLVSMLVDALVPVIRELAPLFGELLRAVMPLATEILMAVVDIVRELAPLFLDLVKAITPLIKMLADALVPVIRTLAPVISQILKALMPVIVKVVEFGAKFLAALMPILPPVMKLIGVLVEALAPVLTEIMKAMEPLIPVIVDLVKSLVGVFEALAPLLIPVLKVLAQILVALLVPAINIIVTVIKFVLQVFTAWYEILASVLSGVVGFVQGVVKWFSDLWSAITGIVVGIWNAVTGWFKAVWDKVSEIVGGLVESVVGFFKGLWDKLVEIVTGLWNSVKEWFTKIWDTAKDIWEKIKNTVSDWANKMVDSIKGIFEGMWNAVKGFFNSVKNWLIDRVVDIANIWNKFVDLLSKIPLIGGLFGKLTIDVGALESLKTMASGGILVPMRVGGGFRTNGPQAIVGEGRRGYPEYVLPTDPQYSKRAVGLWMEAGQRLKMLAGGGVTSPWYVGSWPVTQRYGNLSAMYASGVHSGLDVGYPRGTQVLAGAPGSADHMNNPGGYGLYVRFLPDNAPGVAILLAHMMGYIGSRGHKQKGEGIALGDSTGMSTGDHLHFEVQVNGRAVDPGEWFAAGQGVIGADDSFGIFSGAVNWVREQIEKQLPEGVREIATGIIIDMAAKELLKHIPGSREHGPRSNGWDTNASFEEWAREAIRATGVSDDWLRGLDIIAKHESNYNPRAENLWDINAQRGDPSRGIMQMIGSTFRAHMLPGWTDQLNPVHQIASAIRYILARYRDIYNVPGVKSILAGGSYKPYDNGGVLPPGPTALMNRTGRDEYVLSGTTFNRLLSVLDRLDRRISGAAGDRPIEVHNHYERPGGDSLQDLVLALRMT